MGLNRKLVMSLSCLLIATLAVTPGASRSAVRVAKTQAAYQLRRRAMARADAGEHPAVACGDKLNIAFQIKTFSTGLRAGIWYPTTAAEHPYTYPGRFESAVATDVPVAACGQRYPLVVFSHGFDGCGIQSLFLTEALARAGYIVAAPDHKDAACQVDQPLRVFKLLNRADAPTKQRDYSDASYRYRQQDVETVLNEMLADQRFGPAINSGQIGGIGHSLGGYTMLGVAGAWPSWKDSRIKALLLLSPYVTPYLQKGLLGNVHVPVLFEGGTRDLTITPEINRPGGAYDVSRQPKYYVEIKGAGHLDWSNLACTVEKYVPACAQNVEKVRLIDSYGIAFLNRYLKGMTEPVLEQPNPELADLRSSK